MQARLLPPPSFIQAIEPSLSDPNPGGGEGPLPHAGMFQGYTVAPGHPAWQPPAAQRMPSPRPQGGLPDGQEAGKPPENLADRVRNPKRSAADIERDIEGEGDGVKEPGPRPKAVAPLPADDMVQPELELYEDPQSQAQGSEPVSPEQLIAEGIASVVKCLGVADEVAGFEAAWSAVRRCFHALPMGVDPRAKVQVRARFLMDVGGAVAQAWGGAEMTERRLDTVARRLAHVAGLRLHHDFEGDQVSLFLRGFVFSVKSQLPVMERWVRRFLAAGFSPDLAHHVAYPFTGRGMVYALVPALGGTKISSKSLSFILAEAFSPPHALKPDDPRLQWDGLALQVTGAGLRNILRLAQGPNPALLRCLRQGAPRLSLNQRAYLASGLTTPLLDGYHARPLTNEGKMALVGALLSGPPTQQIYMTTAVLGALAGWYWNGTLAEGPSALVDALPHDVLRKLVLKGLGIAQAHSVSLGLQFVVGLMEMVRIQSDELEARRFDTAARHAAMRPWRRAVEAAVLEFVPSCTTSQAAALGIYCRRNVYPQAYAKKALNTLAQALVPLVAVGVGRAHLDALRAMMTSAFLQELSKEVIEAARADLQQWPDPPQEAGSASALTSTSTSTVTSQFNDAA